MRFDAEGGTISAPNLATFNDNDSHPDSSLTAGSCGVLAFPKLLAPKGININLNALSHPEQFTSLVGTLTFEVNNGTVAVSNLDSITGLSMIIADGGAQLSFPNVMSYTSPAGLSVRWAAYHPNTVLSFPNLVTITGPNTPRTYLDLVAYYDNGPLLSLAALTTITKPDDGDLYANSGVRFDAEGGTISTPNLLAFQDNDSHPNSSLTFGNSGVISAPNLTSLKGVTGTATPIVTPTPPPVTISYTTAVQT